MHRLRNPFMGRYLRCAELEVGKRKIKELPLVRAHKLHRAIGISFAVLLQEHVCAMEVLQGLLP